MDWRYLWPRTGAGYVEAEKPLNFATEARRMHLDLQRFSALTHTANRVSLPPSCGCCPGRLGLRSVMSCTVPRNPTLAANNKVASMASSARLRHRSALLVRHAKCEGEDPSALELPGDHLHQSMGRADRFDFDPPTAQKAKWPSPLQELSH